jgi:hypothetical protein
MIGLSEYRKCALITKVTASTFNFQRLKISAVLLGLDLEFFSLGYNFSTFEIEFQPVLRGEVVIPDLQPCIYLVQRPFLFREMLGFNRFLTGGSYLQWNIRVWIHEKDWQYEKALGTNQMILDFIWALHGKKFVECYWELPQMRADIEIDCQWQVFDDACKSPQSVIILDDIERWEVFSCPQISCSFH